MRLQNINSWWLCVQLYCYRGDNWLVHTCYVIFICRFFIFRLVFSLFFSCPLPSQLIKFLFLESLACQKHYSISIFLSRVLSPHFVVFSSLQTMFYAVIFLFPGLPEKHCLSLFTWKLTWISIRWTFYFSLSVNAAIFISLISHFSSFLLPLHAAVQYPLCKRWL